MKSLGAVLVAALALALPVQAGATDVRRVESRSYVSNGLLIGGHGNLAGQENHLTLPEESAAIVFDPQPSDRFVRFEFEDVTGRTPAVLVHQEGRGHHADELEFCAGAQVFELHSTEPLEIRVFNGLCHNHRYGVATTGTVTATFTR